MLKIIFSQLFFDETTLEQCKCFVIFLGANDLARDKRYVPINEYKDNLSWMVQYLLVSTIIF